MSQIVINNSETEKYRARSFGLRAGENVFYFLAETQEKRNQILLAMLSRLPALCTNQRRWKAIESATEMSTLHISHEMSDKDKLIKNAMRLERREMELDETIDKHERLIEEAEGIRNHLKIQRKQMDIERESLRQDAQQLARDKSDFARKKAEFKKDWMKYAENKHVLQKLHYGENGLSAKSKIQQIQQKSALEFALLELERLKREVTRNVKRGQKTIRLEYDRLAQTKRDLRKQQADLQTLKNEINATNSQQKLVHLNGKRLDSVTTVGAKVSHDLSQSRALKIKALKLELRKLMRQTQREQDNAQKKEKLRNNVEAQHSREESKKERVRWTLHQS